jgi:K+-sensing histidine kinase KdpD
MEDHTQRNWTLQHLMWLGPLCTFAIAKLTAQQSDGLSIANTALILAIFTTAIGAMNPTAGVLTSFTAGAFLNYFHTEPVNSFRMSSASDILMISLFLVLGLGVSIITSFRMRHNMIITNRDTLNAQQEATLATSVSSQHATQFWQSFIEHIDPNLSFLDVCCTSRPKEELPTIARHKFVPTNASTVLIPECGAIVEFLDPRISQVLILKPVTGFAPLEVSRSAIFALSSDVELSLQGTIEK